MAVKQNPKAGQPTKYKPQYEGQALTLAEKGFTDKDIADVFEVTETTINNWKKQFPQFFGSLKKGKEIADQKVVQSLYQRALGYSHPDIHITSHEGRITKTDIIKHYAPDVVACIFWLKNRQPELWRDKQEHVHDVSSNLKTVLEIISGSTKGKLPKDDNKDSSRAS